MCLNCFVVVVFMVYSQKFGVYLYILQFIELILNSFEFRDFELTFSKLPQIDSNSRPPGRASATTSTFYTHQHTPQDVRRNDGGRQYARCAR